MTTSLVQVQDIPNAGRGVVAAENIPAGTVILFSTPPAAHVVFRQYRKEVCAQCFHYDRGRTLPVRDNLTGKVFCSATCETEWTELQGSLGVEAWRSLHTFVRATRKRAVDPDADETMNDTEPRPTAEEIEDAWSKAAESTLPQNAKTLARHLATQPVDSDLLSFYLDGFLEHHRHGAAWETSLRDLAMDGKPYASHADLRSHCTAFQQLCGIRSPAGFPVLDPQICRTLVAAASHNAFGIRAGGEDAEEYMGYAVHPDASYFNHSCAPNVAKKRIGRRWEMRATREIAAGEECCITYLGGDEVGIDVHARRERLRTVWKFECMCERCRSEPSGASAS